MDNREIIKQLIEDEMKRLEELDYARGVDFTGRDKYDSDEEKEAHYRGFKKYTKLKQIIGCFSDDKSKIKISKIVPDWKNIIQELIEDEMKRLEEADYARAVDFAGIDKYDSDEEKRAHYIGFDKYQKISSMKEKLENDKKYSRSSIFPKKETSFLDER